MSSPRPRSQQSKADTSCRPRPPTPALGLDEPPTRWSRRDLAIDIIDKLVLAEATGVVFEQLDRRRS